MRRPVGLLCKTDSHVTRDEIMSIKMIMMINYYCVGLYSGNIVAVGVLLYYGLDSPFSDKTEQRFRN